MHGAILAFILLGFAEAPKFEDNPEAIPVEIVSQAEPNQIMNGEKQAKPATRQAAAAETAPSPPIPPPDLRTAEAQPAPEPPPRPEPPKPEPAPKPAPPP